jgi:hypothetical protein
MSMSDKEMIVKLQTQVEALERAWCTITADIRDIKDNLLKRPSWGTLIIITLLSTTCTALLIAFLNKK